MPYRVTVRRTELITFVVEAESEAEARANYLGEGDELGAETIGLDVEQVEFEE